MILIADSGSTKTDWSVVKDGLKVKSILTKGINPVFQTEEEITEELASSLVPEIKDYPIRSVCFYGAGCIPGKQAAVRQAIAANIAADTIEVNTDMLAAARSLCGRKAGIAGILGTGSNSCYYDGKEIISNVSPLGFILGDEGSGAVLGKLLVGDVLKNQLPDKLKEEFLNTYNLSTGEIIDRVYRKPFPNRFLASLSPFLARHIDVPQVRSIVENSFRSYFRRNVMQYDYTSFPVHLVGSVAYHYRGILAYIAEECGVQLGTIVQQPMEGLIIYHSTR